MLQVECIRPGLFTSFQDQGRPNYQHLGVPLGGFLDRHAGVVANKIVGNTPNSPLLEITLVGPQLHFNESCQIAITGANMSPMINDQIIPNNQAIVVSKDSILKFGSTRSGCRAYLAISGEWQIERTLGSCSPLTTSKTSHTAVLKKGQVFKIVTSRFTSIEADLSLPPVSYPKQLDLEVHIGPEFKVFSRQQIARCFSGTFQLTNDCSRMGLRLSGPKLVLEQPLEMISSAVFPGTIQVSHEGQLILLLADAQTTGGYPRFLQVPERALDQLAQLKPGDHINFKLANLL